MATQPGKKRPRYSKEQEDVKERKGAADVASTSPYADQFQTYREELDSKHDKHERLVKLSRDCTIQSKRTIFLLHRVSGEAEKSKILLEAEAKVHEVQKNFRIIASELVGEDPDKYHRAYSPGIQEFIEALSYLIFLKTGRLIPIDEAQEYLTFREKSMEVVRGGEEEKGDVSKEESMEAEFTRVEHVVLKVPLDPIDFVLGIADLTGELMRLSINSIGSGSHDLPFDLLPFVRAIYCAFSSLRPVSRDIPQKLNVLRSSLGKIEHVCYTLKIRGSEIPKHMLVDVITACSGAQAPGANEAKAAYDSD